MDICKHKDSPAALYAEPPRPKQYSLAVLLTSCSRAGTATANKQHQHDTERVIRHNHEKEATQHEQQPKPLTAMSMVE